MGLDLGYFAQSLIISYLNEGASTLKPYYSIGGFEGIFINLLKSAAFSLQTSENNLKPP